MPMNESGRHVDLLRTFREPHCPVCALLRRDSHRDLRTLMVERINELDTHLAFRAARGLCNHHAWQMAGTKGASLGIAVMFDSTMFTLMKDIASIKPAAGFNRLMGGDSGSQAARTLEPTGACMLCEVMNRTERAYISILAENILDQDLQRAFEQSVGGVCLPHARMVMQQCDGEKLRTFIRIQSERWQRIQDEVQQFIQYNKENIPIEQMGPERDSWQRAIRYLCGDQDIFGFRR